MERLYRKIKEGRSSECLVLVPRRVSANKLRRDLIERLGFIFNLKIQTIPEYFKTLTFRNGSAPRQLPDAVAAEIIGQLAKLHNPGKQAFVNLLKRLSGQKLALNTLQSLILAGISSDDLATCQNANISSIHNLFRDYLNFCNANNIADRALWQMTIIEALEKEKITASSYTDIFVFDFNSIPAHLSRLFVYLAKNANIHFSIPNDPQRKEHFLSNNKLIESFPLSQEHWNLPYLEKSPLEEIQKNLFAGNNQQFPTPEQMTFHQCPGRFDEVEAAAVKIKELIHDQGVLPSKIALSTRSLGSYNQFIEAVMQKLSIPYSYRRGTPMLQSPMVRLVMKLMECHGQKVTFQRLLSILRSSFFKLSGEPLLWQQLITKTGIFKEYLKDWPALLEKYFLESNSEKKDKLLELWESSSGTDLVSTIKIFAEKIRQINTASSPLLALKKFCNSKLFDLESLPEKETWQKHLNSFNKVLDTLLANVETLNSLGLKPLLPELDQLREELKESTIHEKQYLDESISVVTTFDLGYLDIDHLFLIGMDEHTIPKASYASNILFSDSDLYQMNEAGVPNIVEISSSHQRRIAEEQAFILAIGSARKSIDLYHPSFASDGRELSPSPYYAELLRLAGNPAPREEAGGDSREILRSVPEENSIRRQAVRHLYRTDIETQESVTKELYCAMQNSSENNEFFERIDRQVQINQTREQATSDSTQLNKWSGKIDNINLLEKVLHFRDRQWSASSLQTYASCPFAFFLKYVLHLKELELPGEEPDPRSTGSLYHSILKAFVDSSEYPLTSIEKAREKMQGAIESQLPHANAEATKNTHTMLLLKKTKDVMERFLQYEMRQENGLPQHTEFSFDGTNCNLTITDGRELKLRGAFDRIDTLSEDNPQDFLIIDYKLGNGKSKAPKQNTFAKGANLQMPIYLLAASELLKVTPDKLYGKFIGLKKLEIGEANKPGAKAWQVPIHPEDKTEKDEKCLLEIIEEILAGVQRGLFPVKTRDGSKIENLINLVGRWLELPPELAGEEE